MADNIFQAILEVRKNVGVVNKNGQNKFHKYNYATANDVLHEVRDQMNKHGIVIIPNNVSDLSSTKDGNVQHFTQHYVLAHAPSGSVLNAAVRCAGEDKGDKSPYKGNTGALKYLLLQAFLLPTEDDPENDSKDRKPTTKPKPQPSPVPQAEHQITGKPGGEPPEIGSCPTKTEQQVAINKMLIWMANGVPQKAKELLMGYSEYKGFVIDSYDALKAASETRVKIIYGKVKDDFKGMVEKLNNEPDGDGVPF